MQEKYNPTHILKKVLTAKYKASILPVLVILINLFFFTGYRWSVYLSLAAFLAFIYISIRYRVYNAVPPEEEDAILSPIHGKVQSVDESTHTVIIKKSPFHHADYRASGGEMEYELKAGIKLIFEEDISRPGYLVGIIPTTAKCKCVLPAEYQLEVQQGEKLYAGESIIARKK